MAAASIRACTRPSFCLRNHIAVARRTRASFFPLIVSAGNTGRALERDRTSHTTISAPRRAMMSSSNRPTRTLRPQISKPRSSSNDATSPSPRRARSALLDVEQRVADAIASSDPVAARLENSIADESPWAAAGGHTASVGCAAAARAVDLALDFAFRDAGRFASGAIVFLNVVRVTHQSSDEADARCALHRARLEIGLRGQEPADGHLLWRARIAHRAARAAQPRQTKQRNRHKSRQFKQSSSHHAPLRSPRSSTA